MADQNLDSELLKLYGNSIYRVDKSIKSISIALNLNNPKFKSKTPPEELVRLEKWKSALEYWRDVYGNSTDLELISESLGVLDELCRELPSP
ncbi:hypothetical protein HY988_00755 [Candidatus Micrarchaeota archaeon]|nr:hypothetical protein [Candidatus Micrarchaeota archaeon]